MSGSLQTPLTGASLELLGHLAARRGEPFTAAHVCRELGLALGHVNPCLHELKRHGLADFETVANEHGKLYYRWWLNRAQAVVALAAGGVLLPTAPDGPRLRPSALSSR